eukprot:m.209101 g.209101  ORF g.209101 m.209101 type:complete len:303 (-) comp15813_c0_seq3:698-1606(-)
MADYFGSCWFVFLLSCLFELASGTNDNIETSKLNLRGLQKSGTTYVEYFVHNLLAARCLNSDFGEFRYSGRSSSCEFPSSKIAFTPANKHFMLHSSGGHDEALTGALIERYELAECKDFECLLAKVSNVTERTMNLTPLDLFLLVLRDPVETTISHYYHHTAPSMVHQTTMDVYFEKHIRTNIISVAGFWANYAILQRNRTVVWWYDDTPEENAKQLCTILQNCNMDLFDIFISSTMILTSKKTMGIMESQNQLRGMGGQNGKVRTSGISVSPSLRVKMWNQYKGVLPHNLEQRWDSKNTLI